MRIVIGETARNESAGQQRPGVESALIEAKLLEIRNPRQGQKNLPDGLDRHESADSSDSATSRVLVLLVPEGYKIPRGVESGNYRIFLRFAPRSPARA